MRVRSLINGGTVGASPGRNREWTHVQNDYCPTASFAPEPQGERFRLAAQAPLAGQTLS
jgi:hypothetical protein